MRRIALLFTIIVIIAGCSTNKQQHVAHEINPEPYIVMVQAAVDGYVKEHAVLPIQNSDMMTPIYEKYKVDFVRLKEHGYIHSIPENAFENGGSHYYVIVNPETEPAVKLLHIPSARQAKDVERLVMDYANKNNGAIPKVDSVSAEWFTIDYSKLKIDQVQVRSVYSGQYLGLLVHSTGRVIIDYASEIMQAMMRNQLTEADEALDLRTLLVDHSYFVPSESNAYYWKNNEPVLSSRIE